MKGHTENGKFHPHTQYKKVGRKKREPFPVASDGVKVDKKQLIQMQRQPRNKRTDYEPDQGWNGIALSIPQLSRMYNNCDSEFAHEGKANLNAIKNYYKGSATHQHARTSCDEYKGYCYYCGLNLDATDEINVQKRTVLQE